MCYFLSCSIFIYVSPKNDSAKMYNMKYSRTVSLYNQNDLSELNMGINVWTKEITEHKLNHGQKMPYCITKTDYKNAHQFKLDVNRIARKKNYLV